MDFLVISMRQYKIAKPLLIIFALLLPNKAHCSKRVKIIPAEISTYQFYEIYRGVGNVEVTKSKDLIAGIDGRIEYITPKEGSKIDKGDIVLTINGKAAIEQKKAKELAFEVAKKEYQRNLSLYQRKVIPIEVMQKSELSKNQASAELEAFNSDYKNIVITAPFAGYVGAINAKIGDYVKAGANISTLIAEEDSCIVYSTIPDKYVTQITKADKCTIIDGDKNKAECQIEAISPYLNQTGTGNIKLSTQQSENSRFIHGGFYDIFINYNFHKSLAVPEAAILKDNNGEFVFKVDEDGFVTKTYLVLGIRTNNMRELKSQELSSGDIIVLEGLTKVQDGSYVEL